jgi:O-antigen ligase
MKSYIENLKLLNYKEWILLLSPFALLKPSFINIILVLSSFIFIFEIVKNKNFKLMKLKWVYFYLTFIFFNIINGFFATDFLSSIKSSISQLRFLFFSLFIYVCIFNIKNFNVILNTWLALLFFISLDGIYQYFFDVNFFNIQAHSSRISGLFGNELVLGSYLTYISIPLFFFHINKIKNYDFFGKIVIILIYATIFFTIIISTERMVTIVSVLSLIFIITFYLKIKKALLLLIILSTFLSILYYKNIKFNQRFNEALLILNNFHESSYGRLYESSYNLFKENIFFGVGLKNYRVDCNKQIDPRPNSIHQFCSSHPHNLYLELLSETGLIGSLLFSLSFFYLFWDLKKKIKLNFKKSYFRDYSFLMYGNLLVIFFFLWPIKTSGSFFTTFNGSFFWFNLGLALLVLKKNNKTIS